VQKFIITIDLTRKYYFEEVCHRSPIREKPFLISSIIVKSSRIGGGGGKDSRVVQQNRLQSSHAHTQTGRPQATHSCCLVAGTNVICDTRLKLYFRLISSQ
jgi:hypothetical protein